MKKVTNKLQVWHHAQVPCEPFRVDVKNEEEAKKICDVLADQHLFLFKHKIIPDYCNTILVLMWDEDENDWVDYWNEAEAMDWDELEEAYLQPKS